MSWLLCVPSLIALLSAAEPVSASESPAASIVGPASEPLETESSKASEEPERAAAPASDGEPIEPETPAEPGESEKDGEPKPAPKPARPQSSGGVTWYAPPGSLIPVRRGMRWDVNVDLSFGRLFAPNGGRWLGAARARAGLLFIMEPLFPAIGLTAEGTTLQPPRFGVQVESLHLWTGLWAQFGADYDTKKRVGFHGAVGHDLLGLEAQSRRHVNGDYVWSIVGKVRIPLGIIAMELASTKALTGKHDQ